MDSNNDRSNTKSKHVDVRVQNSQISIEHIGRNSMVADSLSKGLAPKVSHEYIAHMGVSHFSNLMV